LAEASPVQANVPAAIARAATEAVRMDFMVMFVSDPFWRAIIAADECDPRDAPNCSL
jgi:hypothetical protein